MILYSLIYIWLIILSIGLGLVIVAFWTLFNWLLEQDIII